MGTAGGAPAGGVGALASAGFWVLQRRHWVFLAKTTSRQEGQIQSPGITAVGAELPAPMPPSG